MNKLETLKECIDIAAVIAAVDLLDELNPNLLAESSGLQKAELIADMVGLLADMYDAERVSKEVSDRTGAFEKAFQEQTNHSAQDFEAQKNAMLAGRHSSLMKAAMHHAEKEKKAGRPLPFNPEDTGLDLPWTGEGFTLWEIYGGR